MAGITEGLHTTIASTNNAIRKADERLDTKIDGSAANRVDEQKVLDTIGQTAFLLQVFEERLGTLRGKVLPDYFTQIEAEFTKLVQQFRQDLAFLQQRLQFLQEEQQVAYAQIMQEFGERNWGISQVTKSTPLANALKEMGIWWNAYETWVHESQKIPNKVREDTPFIILAEDAALANLKPFFHLVDAQALYRGKIVYLEAYTKLRPDEQRSVQERLFQLCTIQGKHEAAASLLKAIGDGLAPSFQSRIHTETPNTSTIWTSEAPDASESYIASIIAKLPQEKSIEGGIERYLYGCLHGILVQLDAWVKLSKGSISVAGIQKIITLITEKPGEFLAQMWELMKKAGAEVADMFTNAWSAGVATGKQILVMIIGAISGGIGAGVMKWARILDDIAPALGAVADVAARNVSYICRVIQEASGTPFRVLSAEDIAKLPPAARRLVLGLNGEVYGTGSIADTARVVGRRIASSLHENTLYLMFRAGEDALRMVRSPLWQELGFSKGMVSTAAAAGGILFTMHKSPEAIGNLLSWYKKCNGQAPQANTAEGDMYALAEGLERNATKQTS